MKIDSDYWHRIVSLATLFGKTADGVYIIDSMGVIRFWNAAAERILGYPARDVLGKFCRDIFQGVDDNGNRICCENCPVRAHAFDNEPLGHFRMRTSAADGRRVWLDISVISVPAAPGGTPFVVYPFRDVTVSHEIESLVRSRWHTSVGDTANEDADARAATLTARQREVLLLLKRGIGTTAIANQLGISAATVRNHMQNIFAKLGVHNRLEAIALTDGRLAPQRASNVASIADSRRAHPGARGYGKVHPL